MNPGDGQRRVQVVIEGLVEGLVKRFKDELGDPETRVVATGGWAKQLAAETNCIDVVDQELTLTGLVMPIGGVKEKMIASKRSKVQEVILPKENQEDFEMLPEHIREGITAHFVSTFEEIRRICFP